PISEIRLHYTHFSDRIAAWTERVKVANLPAARAAIQEKYCTGPELFVSEKVVPLDTVANTTLTGAHLSEMHCCSRFLVEVGACRMVASTIVPVVIRTPCACRCRFTCP